MIIITTININLENKNDFYSKFSKDKLSKELTEYIYDECYGENYKNHITININTKKEISKEEKQNMMDIIRRTYGLMVQDEMYYHEKHDNIKTILLITGIVLIILYYCAVVSILKEIILILGWLAIWESIYSLLFDSSKDRMRITRLKELSKARIYFYSSSKDSNS